MVDPQDSEDPIAGASDRSIVGSPESNAGASNLTADSKPPARQPVGATKPQFNLTPLTILLVAGLLIAGYMNVQTTYKYQKLVEEHQQLKLVLARQHENLELNLPSPAGASNASVPLVTPGPIEIDIDKEGRFSIGGAPLSLEKIQLIFKRSQTNSRAPQTALIRTDRDTKIEHLLELYSLCKKEGIQVGKTEFKKK